MLDNLVQCSRFVWTFGHSAGLLQFYLVRLCLLYAVHSWTSDLCRSAVSPNFDLQSDWTNDLNDLKCLSQTPGPKHFENILLQFHQKLLFFWMQKCCEEWHNGLLFLHLKTLLGRNYQPWIPRSMVSRLSTSPRSRGWPMFRSIGLRFVHPIDDFSWILIVLEGWDLGRALLKKQLSRCFCWYSARDIN